MKNVIYFLMIGAVLLGGCAELHIGAKGKMKSTADSSYHYNADSAYRHEAQLRRIAEATVREYELNAKLADVQRWRK